MYQGIILFLQRTKIKPLGVQNYEDLGFSSPRTRRKTNRNALLINLSQEGKVNRQKFKRTQIFRSKSRMFSQMIYLPR